MPKGIVAMAERAIAVENSLIVSEIFGSYDSNIKLIEDRFEVRIYNRNDNGNSIVISGNDEENVEFAAKTVSYLKKCALSGDGVNEQITLYAMNMCVDGMDTELSALDDSCVCITSKGKPIKAKTVGQKKYVLQFSMQIQPKTPSSPSPCRLYPRRISAYRCLKI